MQNREAVIAELDRVQPTHVLNAAGSTGRPNVDWCEDHKEETMRNNVIGTLNLTDVCFLKGIHVTVFATGCIYAYDEKHPIGGAGFLETDAANFSGSFYSETKAHIEEVSIPELFFYFSTKTYEFLLGHEALRKLPYSAPAHARQR